MWLNLLMDDHHFGYITKLTPKKKQHYCSSIAFKQLYKIIQLVSNMPKVLRYVLCALK